MKNTLETIKFISNGAYDGVFADLYGAEKVAEQRARWITALESFGRLYGENRAVRLFSSPGRSEILGNHTDHNHGCVLAAAVNLDTIAVVGQNDDDTIRLKSEGFDGDIVKAKDNAPGKYLQLSSASLIAGVCGGLSERGHMTGGFDAYTTSSVLKGSGLSSSAAFEVLVGSIQNELYNDGKISAPELAMIAQYAENVYFGKPCGLMDQTACAVGGFVAIDFAETSGHGQIADAVSPKIKKLTFNPEDAGYTLCIVNTGGSHADLNEDYASIPREMKAVAAKFGRGALRGLTAEELIARIPELRAEVGKDAVGDRAILRALHFIAENERVSAQVEVLQSEALKNGDMDAFLSGVDASGRSSFEFLQNVFTVNAPREQGLSLALALTDEYFAVKGINNSDKRIYACRVHGGGFAGTIQAFVPSVEAAGYAAFMDGIFGEGACIPLRIRRDGVREITGV